MCGERRPGVGRVERRGMQGAVPCEGKPFLGLVGRRGSVGKSLQRGRPGVRSWVVVSCQISRHLGWVRRLESRCSWNYVLRLEAGEQ
jgi:hypothetical protein